MMTNGDKKIIPGEVMQIPLDEWVLDILAKQKEMLRAMNHGKVFECTHGEIVINMHEGHVQSISVKNRTYQHTSSGSGLPRVLP